MSNSFACLRSFFTSKVPTLLCAMAILSAMSSPAGNFERGRMRSAEISAGKCVNILYDRGPQEYWMGRIYATFVQNLLGHFPEYQQVVIPMEKYQKGDLDQCSASIYIGSYFPTVLSKQFLQDYEKTRSRVAWLGYHIWQAPELFERIFAHRYSHLTTLDYQHRDAEGRPGYYKWIDYKGERFWRYGQWSQQNPSEFVSSFEMIALNPLKNHSGVGPVEVLATATHSGTGAVLPYVLRSKNYFYIADVGFSFMHEADRFLVIADLLFDILGEGPRHKKRHALMRMEDVHPAMEAYLRYPFLQAVNRLGISMGVSIIPFFYDSFQLQKKPNFPLFTSASREKEFQYWLSEVQRSGHYFIWHGVTHQYKKMRNPHDGMTGSDFEFWNAIENRPIDEDRVDWYWDRLQEGFHELGRVGVRPQIWLTPHYQASALFDVFIGRMMPWSIGRVIYFNHEFIRGIGPVCYFQSGCPLQRIEQSLRGLDLKVMNRIWSGQMFPYEIYGDIYGQRLLPESLGNSQPYQNHHVIQPRSVEEMVADAKRQRVIRDAWASFFYHPFLLQPYELGGRGAFAGDTREMEYVIEQIKALGYEFINAEEFVKKNDFRRPDPIYR